MAEGIKESGKVLCHIKVIPLVVAEGLAVADHELDILLEELPAIGAAVLLPAEPLGDVGQGDGALDLCEVGVLEVREDFDDGPGKAILREAAAAAAK